MPAKKGRLAEKKPQFKVSAFTATDRIPLTGLAARLAVAGYPQNDGDDPVGHRSNRLGYDVEIEPNLRANHRQDEKQPDQDDHPVGFQSSKRGGKRIREQPYSDPTAVERWQWQQIEDCRR
jgi:hypothetical protein